MKVNTIDFRLFDLPIYFVCAWIGMVLAICIYIFLLYRHQFPLLPHIKALACSMLGLILGARLFGCLSGVYRAIGVGEIPNIKTLKNTGIVFYGGLFGLLGTYAICIKSKLIQEHRWQVLDLLAIPITLFHAIARIGCFFAGCCFGVESDLFFSVQYTTLIQGVASTSYRLPVQLFESTLNLVLFFYLLFLSEKSDWKNKNILLRYLLIYSFGRFLLEFIRGDTVRGIIHGISFSQIISILIWLVILLKNIFHLKEANT